MYTIGLTGSIGAGKSTVARHLESTGVHVIYADQLGHEAYLPNTSCFHDVVSEFGPEIVAQDGTIDRRILGKIVFADRAKLQRLNDIVWPAIKRLAKSRFEQIWIELGVPIIFLEAAVLIEANWHTFVDEVWTVLAEKTNVIHRALNRDNCTEDKLKQRMDVQISTDKRVSLSKVVIYNDGSLGDLHAAIDQELIKLHQRIKGEN